MVGASVNENRPSIPPELGMWAHPVYDNGKGGGVQWWVKCKEHYCAEWIDAHICGDTTVYQAYEKRNALTPHVYQRILLLRN